MEYDYYLCERCEKSIKIVEKGKNPVGICRELVTTTRSGYCGGEFTLELVPKIESKGEFAPVDVHMDSEEPWQPDKETIDEYIQEHPLTKAIEAETRKYFKD